MNKLDAQRMKCWGRFNKGFVMLETASQCQIFCKCMCTYDQVAPFIDFISLTDVVL